MPQKGWLHAIGTTEIFRIHDGNMPQEQRQYAVETTDYSTRILRVVPSLMRTTLTPGVYPLMRRPSVVWRDFTMIGVCSLYPFGVVIWQDVSNMPSKRWHDATIRCKGTQKSSIIATFGAT